MAVRIMAKVLKPVLERERDEGLKSWGVIEGIEKLVAVGVQGLQVRYWWRTSKRLYGPGGGTTSMT